MAFRIFTCLILMLFVCSVVFSILSSDGKYQESVVATELSSSNLGSSIDTAGIKEIKAEVNKDAHDCGKLALVIKLENGDQKRTELETKNWPSSKGICLERVTLQNDSKLNLSVAPSRYVRKIDFNIYFRDNSLSGVTDGPIKATEMALIIKEMSTAALLALTEQDSVTQKVSSIFDAH